MTETRLSVNVYCIVNVKQFSFQAMLNRVAKFQCVGIICHCTNRKIDAFLVLYY